MSSLQSNVFKKDTEGGIESVAIDQNANKKNFLKSISNSHITLSFPFIWDKGQ